MKKLYPIIFATIFCFGFVTISVAHANSVSIRTNADTCDFSNHPDNNYGSQTTTYVFNQAQAHGASFFNFDLSSIPAHSTINSAYLQTYLTFCDFDPGYSFKVSLLDRDWTENNLTWNNQPQPVSSIGMLGYPCAVPQQNTFYNFDVSNLIQATVNGQYAWHGLSLSSVNGSSTYHYNIDTKEQSPTVAAKLAVDFTPPPGSNNASNGGNQTTSNPSGVGSSNSSIQNNQNASQNASGQPSVGSSAQNQKNAATNAGLNKATKILGTTWPLWFTILIIAGPILAISLGVILALLVYKRKKKPSKSKTIKKHPMIKY